MSERSAYILVADMLEAVERIDSYVDDVDYDWFVKDTKTADAVMRNLQILGEAANRVPENVRNRAPDIEWSRIIRSRHILVHQYFGIDYEIVWRIITVHLPALHPQLVELLERIKSD